MPRDGAPVDTRRTAERTTTIEASGSGGGTASRRASIRLVAHEDLPALEVLERTLFGDVAYSMQLLRTFYTLCGTTWHVADIGGDVAGYALVGLSTSSEGWLLGLAVGSRHQGQGLGSALMARALSTMMESGVAHAYLTVRPDNQAARRICEQFEFAQEGDQVPDYYGNREPRLILHRSLVNNPYSCG